MSKSRHNSKWFDADDYEYESKDVYSSKKKNRYDEIALRREQKFKTIANTFAAKDDDWD